MSGLRFFSTLISGDLGLFPLYPILDTKYGVPGPVLERVGQIPSVLVRKKETRDFLTRLFRHQRKGGGSRVSSQLFGRKCIPHIHNSDRLSGASFCQEHDHSATHYAPSNTAEMSSLEIHENLRKSTKSTNPQIHKRSGKCPLGPSPRLFPFDHSLVGTMCHAYANLEKGKLKGKETKNCKNAKIECLINPVPNLPCHIHTHWTR